MSLVHVIILFLLTTCTVANAKLKGMPIKDIACSKDSLIKPLSTPPY